MISGAADTVTELLFGGMGKGVKALGLSSGLSSADDMLAKALSSKINNQIGKNLVQFGIKSSAEGLEEVLAGLGQAVGKKLTYMSEEDIGKIIEDENLLEQFIVGSLTSAIMQTGDLVKANKNKSDFVTNYTQDEQAVIEAETNKRIAERENNGAKLTKNQKKAIEEQVQKDMDRGYISTDTIEELFGGDTYKAYQEAVTKEGAVLKELSDLYEGDELKRQIADFLKNSESVSLKTKLNEEVYKHSMGQRFAESYNEVGRRKQKFTANLTKYDDKQKVTVQKAIDSGVLNNSNRTHELVDLVAKIAADKGVSFDFTNNAKLKESGFAIDGKQVNGFVTKDGVTLNVNSSKYLNSVVGHEITHVLEGTELYAKMQNVLFEYAKGRKASNSKFQNEYQERLYNARELYKDEEGYEGVNGFEAIKNEVAADLVGDYLFTDADFINRLYVGNRNVFQKLWDEIEYLCKVATAGSKEARRLEKVKRAFEQAYRENSQALGNSQNTKNTAQTDGVQYSVSVPGYVNNVGNFAEQVDNIDKIPSGEALVVCGTPKAFTDIGLNRLPMTLNREHTKDAISLNSNHPDRYIGDATLKDLPRALQKPVAIIASSSQTGTSLVAIVDLQGKNGKSVIAPVYLNGISKANGIRMDVNAIASVHERRNAIKGLLMEAIRSEAQGNIGIFYVDNAKATQLIRGEGLQLPNSFMSMNGFVHSITENGSPVKNLFKSVEQTETKQFKRWFGKSKVLDEDGKPLVVYHGTDAEFFEFDIGMGRANMDIQGAFFSPYKLDAQGYGKNVGEFYLSLQNPADERTAYRALNRFKGQNNAGIKAREYLIQQGYDGVFNGYDEYIAFYPSQIKSVAENIGTYDGSNPDIRYSLTPEVAYVHTKKGNLPTPTGEQAPINTPEANNGIVSNDKISQTGAEVNAEYSRKEQQFEIIRQSNPASDEYHTWIRSVDDIKTFQETLTDPEWEGYDSFDPDYTLGMAQEAVKSGVITVYSSYPIGNGVFVSPSRMEAESYSGNGNVYEQTVRLEDVAWIDPTQGQYAPVNKQYSLSQKGEVPTTQGNWHISGEDVQYQGDIAPDREDIASVQDNIAPLTEEAKTLAPDDIVPPVAGTDPEDRSIEALIQRKEALEAQMQKANEAGNTAEEDRLHRQWQEVAQELYYADRIEELEMQIAEARENGDTETQYRMEGELNEAKMEFEKLKKQKPVRLTKRKTREIAGQVRKTLGLANNEMATARDIIERYRTGEISGKEQLVQELQERLGRYTEKNTDEYLADVIKTLRSSPVAVSEDIKRSIADYGQWYKRNFGKLKFSKDGMPVDEFYYDLNSQYPGMFPESIINPEDQLLRMAEVANMVSTEEIQIERDAVQFDDAAGDIIREVEAARQTELTSPYADKITVLENELSDKNAFISKKAKELYDEIRNIKKGQKASADLGYLLDHIGEDIGWRTIRVACLNAANQPEGIVDKNNSMEPVVRELLEDKYKEAGYELERLQKEEDNLLSNPTYQRAVQRRKKQEQMDAKATELIGDTTYWKDKPLGIGYKTNTLRRNLRDIVRGPDGKRNVAAADRIWDWLQGTYNTNEAKLKQEFNRITAPVAELGLNKQEAVYTQMLGEFRHNPDSTVTPQIIEEFLAEHKDKIDEAKVDEAITQIRQIYDDILPRVNETLREFGMKEIPYRQGYFPHFVEEKQGKLAKLLNWKTQKTDIPTSIAGMTEEFKPKKSWQSFDKQRMGDITEYNALQGLDTYLHGALDWIYHIEDIQRRRTVENYIRYIHSDEGVKAKIDELKASNEYDADELQEQIDLILKEAANPLGNFVTDLRTGTNTLAGKKSSMDRGMEAMFNRQVYSTMTNVSNRVSANQVVASISSAMTNFIPITQSWGEVSPISSLIAMGDTLRADVKGGDGIIEKSTFLTNRLATEQKLYKTTWDKIGEKAGWLMEAVDSFTSQTVWRSKYMENLKAGMSENEAIRNADQFAENVIAGRSRGNMPTIFDSKNPLIKIMTAFQLEVANHYGYLFKDMPQDVQKNRVGRLAAGYAKIFIGAYVYNALYSSLMGRTAALDPIRMIQEFLSDIFDDEDDEELVDNLLDFGDEVLEEVPFIGGLVGGGRIPISSAFPYGEGPWQIVTNTAADISEGNWENLTKEWMNPLYYIAMPMGGGQLKKTVQGLSMFSDDLPMPGSYTDSGNLRFPVDETLGNVLQAGIFGQWASENARDYFDNKRAPLNEKQIQKLIDSGWTIQEYWDYQDEMKHIAASIEEGTATDDEILTYKYMCSEDADFSNYGKVEYDEFNGVRYANIGDTYYDWYEPGEDAEDQTPYWRKLDDEQTTKYIVTREAGEGAYYATNGEVSYCWYKPDGDVDDQTPHWKKITDEQLEKQEEVTESLGITPEEYWSKKEEYTFAYEYPRKYQFARAVGGYDAYRRYSGELSGIQSDKDSYGKSISGSRKKKVIAYVNGLDADYGTKVILFKSEYPSDDTYNYEIVDYLNGRKDISYEEMEAILKYLGFDVDENGNITWD